MSGRRRNLAPLQKFNFPPGRRLPEIIKEFDSDTENSYSAKVKLNYTTEPSNLAILSNERRHNSIISSAASQRFIEFYNKADWPSLSDTGTDSPGCIDLESGSSSASSVFSWVDSDATKMVAEEWEKIQRTLYDEEGSKVTQKHLIEECVQWKTIFPHLRVVGKKMKDLSISSKADFDDNVICSNDVDFDDGYSIDRRIADDFEDDWPRRSGDRFNTSKNHSVRLSGARNGSSIIRSEISSSRWRQKSDASPDFTSLPHQNSTSINEYIPSRKCSAASLNSVGSKSLMSNNDSFFKNSLKKDRNIYLEPVEFNPASRMMPIRSISITHAVDVPKSSSLNKNIALPPLYSNENKMAPVNSTPVVKKHRRNKTLAPLNFVNVKLNGSIEDRNFIPSSTRKKKRNHTFGNP